MLQAASRMGVPTEHAGILGNGLWAHFIRQSFQDNGITHIGQDRLDEDSGFRVVLSSGAPKKTFIASYGAEAHGDSDTFDTLEPQPKDVVHISGNTLMDHTATGVDGFLLKAGTDPAARDYTLVINPTNTLRLVNDHMLEDLVLARPVWSCNRQEAMTLAERLGAPIDDSKVTIGGGLDDFMHQLCDGLGATLRAPLVVRVGARGAWIREPGGETIHIEGYPTKAVHTRSAGGCHTGVMCAMLAKGHSLAESVKIANAAAAIAIAHAAGVSLDDADALHAIESVRIAGRMEQFRDPQSNTLAIVDYAYNYASVTALLDFVYERWGEENPRITLVTGSAGNKAYDRRKEIVEAAENRIANFIFTAEDTDTEPIIDICMEMQGYITNKDVVSTVISDRLTAITNAIYDARAHADRFNILLIIGKGNERWIKDHRKHVPFDGDDHVVERMFGL